VLVHQIDPHVLDRPHTADARIEPVMNSTLSIGQGDEFNVAVTTGRLSSVRRVTM
jgi:hypothetical protein